MPTEREMMSTAWRDPATGEYWPGTFTPRHYWGIRLRTGYDIWRAVMVTLHNDCFDNYYWGA